MYCTMSEAPPQHPPSPDDGKRKNGNVNVLSRLRQRFELLRSMHDSKRRDYDESIKDVYKREHEETLIYHQKWLQSKVKKASKRPKEPPPGENRTAVVGQNQLKRKLHQSEGSDCLPSSPPCKQQVSAAKLGVDGATPQLKFEEVMGGAGETESEFDGLELLSGLDGAEDVMMSMMNSSESDHILSMMFSAAEASMPSAADGNEAKCTTASAMVPQQQKASGQDQFLKDTAVSSVSSLATSSLPQQQQHRKRHQQLQRQASVQQQQLSAIQQQPSPSSHRSCSNAAPAGYHVSTPPLMATYKSEPYDMAGPNAASSMAAYSTSSPECGGALHSAAMPMAAPRLQQEPRGATMCGTAHKLPMSRGVPVTLPVTYQHTQCSQAGAMPTSQCCPQLACGPYGCNPGGPMPGTPLHANQHSAAFGSTKPLSHYGSGALGSDEVDAARAAYHRQTSMSQVYAPMAHQQLGPGLMPPNFGNHMQSQEGSARAAAAYGGGTGVCQQPQQQLLLSQQQQQMLHNQQQRQLLMMQTQQQHVASIPSGRQLLVEQQQVARQHSGDAIFSADALYQQQLVHQQQLMQQQQQQQMLHQQHLLTQYGAHQMAQVGGGAPAAGRMLVQRQQQAVYESGLPVTCHLNERDLLYPNQGTLGHSPMPSGGNALGTSQSVSYRSGSSAMPMQQCGTAYSGGGSLPHGHQPPSLAQAFGHAQGMGMPVHAMSGQTMSGRQPDFSCSPQQLVSAAGGYSAAGGQAQHYAGDAMSSRQLSAHGRAAVQCMDASSQQTPTAGFFGSSADDLNDLEAILNSH